MGCGLAVSVFGTGVRYFSLLFFFFFFSSVGQLETGRAYANEVCTQLLPVGLSQAEDKGADVLGYSTRGDIDRNDGGSNGLRSGERI